MLPYFEVVVLSRGHSQDRIHITGEDQRSGDRSIKVRLGIIQEELVAVVIFSYPRECLGLSFLEWQVASARETNVVLLVTAKLVPSETAFHLVEMAGYA